MKRAWGLVFKGGKKEPGLGKPRSGAEGSVPRNIDEYDQQVLEKLDKGLQLKTFTFPVPKGYRRHNFKYLTRTQFLPTSQIDQVDKALKERYEQSLLDPKLSLAGMQELRPVPKELKEYARTTIEPVVSARTGLPSYRHLVSLQDSNPYIQRFLESERNFLDWRLKENQLHAGRIVREWCDYFREAQGHLVRVTNNWVLQVQQAGGFRVVRRDYSNLKGLLAGGDEGSPERPLVSSLEIRHYFLNFRDDFSYRLLRHSRYVNIQEKHIERLFFSADESLLGVQIRFRPQAVPVVLFKDLSTDCWADFYFAEDFVFIDFCQNRSGSYLVYCLSSELEVKSVALKSEEFFTIQKFGRIGKFIFDHIVDNSEKLRLNAVDAKKLAAQTLLTVPQGSALALHRFGGHSFLQVNHPGNPVPSFYYVTGESVVEVPVGSQEYTPQR